MVISRPAAEKSQKTSNRSCTPKCGQIGINAHNNEFWAKGFHFRYGLSWWRHWLRHKSNVTYLNFRCFFRLFCTAGQPMTIILPSQISRKRRFLHKWIEKGWFSTKKIWRSPLLKICVNYIGEYIRYILVHIHVFCVSDCYRTNPWRQ